MKAMGNLRFLELACLLLTLFGVCGLQKVDAAPSAPVKSGESGEDRERRVLNYLWPVLKSAHKVGRIYYGDACPQDDQFPRAFPQVDVRPALRDEMGLAAVRSIFSKKNDVEVDEDSPGIIRVRIGRVPDVILRTRISILKLTPDAQFNYQFAIDTIEKAPEVRAAMDELHVRVPVRYSHFLLAQPADELPHLPSEISGVTMDQALDMVARTWSGIVLFGSCTRLRTYEITFARGVYFHDSTN